MPDESATTEKTHIVVGWDEEYESAFVYQAGDGEADPRMFEADVPSALWEELLATRRAYAELERRIAELAGFDPSVGRMAACCCEWRGDVTPGGRWFSLVLAASGSEEEWPVRDVSISSEETRAAAEARIADLPEEFYLHYGSANRLVLVRRDRFRVKEGGYAPIVSRCHRCGWHRDEHPGGEADAVLPAGEGLAAQRGVTV